MRNPLLDLEFLRKLDLMRNKATYAKIILLTWDENPVYEVQGKITAGSINIDGASAVRRTCSLTMVSPDVDITNTYWALKNKFKLEVGVENEIDSQYPDIIWFKQGIYVFTGLNMNVQSNNFTISLNGKDKMCLLNGEVGGSINVSTDFGQLEEYTTLDTGEIIRNITKIPIVDIVKNLLHAHGKEPLNKIVINDVDKYGLELLEYRGNSPLFLIRNNATGEVTNMTFDGGQKYYLEDGTEVYISNTKNIKEEKPQIKYYDRTKLYDDNATKLWVNKNGALLKEVSYSVIKIVFGETAGYRQTDLTYPGDLIANVGETVVSVLDKLKNMFSNFEYFYDIDGNFIFQKKQDYFNTSWNNITQRDEEIYAENALYESSASYSFENGVLLSAFTDAPAILDIKNDYSIWGNREGVSGTDLPVHMRYAIDHKPKYYKPIRFIISYEEVKLSEATYERNKYYLYEEEEYVLSTKKFRSNWTYYEKKQTQDLNIEPMVSLEWEEDYLYLGKIEAFIDGKKYYIKTNSGYEQAANYQDNIDYYVKYMKYDWRELIYQMALDYFKYGYTNSNFSHYIAQANPEYYPTGITGYEVYYTDMQGFWRELYHPGVLGEEVSEGYYNWFTENELKNAAKELILRERAFIEEENITNLIINYVYDNYEIFKEDVVNETEQLIKWDSDTALFEILDVELNFLYAAHQKKYYNDWVAAQGIGAEQLMRIIVSVLDSTSDEKNEFKKAVKEMVEQQIYKKEYDFSDELIEYIYENHGAYEKDENVFFEYDSKQIIVKNSHIQYLLDMRAEKIKEMGKADFVLDNTTLVLAIIQTLEEVAGSGISTAIQFKDRVQKKLDSVYEDLDKIEEIDFSEKILEYFSENKRRWFYKDSDPSDMKERNFLYTVVNNTIFIKDSYLKYLFTLRQEKITKTKDINFYPNNEQLMSIIVSVIQEELVSGRNFISTVKARMDGYYKSEIDPEYDLSLEIIEYISTNYSIRNTMFNQISENKIEITNSYLAQIFEQRQEKLKNISQGSKWLSNELLLSVIFDIINDTTIKTGQDFKEIMEIEINTDESDIMQEILDRIKQENYELLSGTKGLIVISSIPNNNQKPMLEINKEDYPEFNYLFAKRYEKMQRLGDTTNITNDEVIEIFYNLFSDKNIDTSDKFLSGWKNALEARE